MIHEIFPHHFYNQFLALRDIGDEDYVLHYKENSQLLKRSGEDFEIPRKKDLPGISNDSGFRYLFALNNVHCFLITSCPEIDYNLFIYQEINFFRKYKQKEAAWISLVGFQLMNWYAHNRFCGKCGAETTEKTDERALICPVCNTMVYPKISPAIIVAIVCNDKILLAHSNNFPGKWYSLIAGYADIGESLEEAVMREVKEEVGLEVKNIRYYKSQPWPFSSSMMIGFFAEADDKQRIQTDNKEISDAAWFNRGNLPDHPAQISIAGEMIDKFEQGLI